MSTAGKLKNLPEIDLIAWVFWLVFWCCVVWRRFTIDKKCLNFGGLSPLSSVWKRKKMGSYPDEYFQDWSLKESINIPVWSKYLHSSSLCKQKLICRSFEISSDGKFRIDLWFWGPDYSHYKRDHSCAVPLAVVPTDSCGTAKLILIV